MLKLAGEHIEGQLGDHIASLNAHMDDTARLHRTGRMYVGGGATPEALGANTLYAGALWVVRTMTFDRIEVDVTVAAAAGKNARLGIYRNGDNCYPGSLLLDAGEVPVDSTGLKAININLQLVSGLYWITCVSDGAPTANTATTSGLFRFLGAAEATGLTIGRAWFANHAYAALPDPFTAGGSLDSFCFRNYGVLRVASLD
ncbi:MAG: hypothetical protein PHR56_06520 [Dehalococcoidales bacterium]|nr:hypothetical protein [Dehalococcoidales bacterium]